MKKNNPHPLPSCASCGKGRDEKICFTETGSGAGGCPTLTATDDLANANRETDLNILLGLCVGHDSLFFKYADAPTTVLAVKDRVTGHNPLAAIYTAASYYAKVHHPEIA